MSDYRIIGGDIGTKIVFTVREWPVGTTPVPNTLAPVVNLATATNLKLILTPPSGILSQGVSEQTVTATLYTDGTDGNLTYTTIAGDVPSMPMTAQPQLWQVRPQFTLGGWTGKGKPDSFWVDA